MNDFCVQGLFVLANKLTQSLAPVTCRQLNVAFDITKTAKLAVLLEYRMERCVVHFQVQVASYFTNKFPRHFVVATVIGTADARASSHGKHLTYTGYISPCKFTDCGARDPWVAKLKHMVLQTLAAESGPTCITSTSIENRIPGY